MTYIQHYDSPFGGITLASDGDALTGLWFDGQKYFGSTLTQNQEQKKLLIFEQATLWLNLYFDGKEPDFTPSLSINTTLFREVVWKIMFKIPYGKTMSYGEIAREVARQRGVEKMSAHAVGGAVSHNPISLLIPCHRVVGTNGSLTGYAGGIERKLQLLALEKADMSKLFIPAKGTAL